MADAEQAIEHLQRALTLDPNYALAYARLADAILIQAESTTGIDAARPVVAPLLDKALTLDPELGEAYALRSRLSDDPVAAERDLRRGLELNPSYARGYEMLANLQTASLPQLDLALDSIDTRHRTRPAHAGNFHSKALLMMGKGYWPEAAELDRRALELNPNFRAALEQFCTAVLQSKDISPMPSTIPGQAVAIDQRAVPLRDKLVLLYLAVGDIDSARAVNIPTHRMGQLGTARGPRGKRHGCRPIYSGESTPMGKLARCRSKGMPPRLVTHSTARRQFRTGITRAALTRLSTARPLTDFPLPPDASCGPVPLCES